MQRSTRPSAPALATLLLALCAAGLAHADGDPSTDDVPRLLPYQGVLELDGAPVEAAGDAALHLLFSLYDGPAAEQPVYSQRLRVEVFTGRFTATIGPTGEGPDGAEVPLDTVIMAADDLHLGMTLLGDPDDPADDVALNNRQRIYATPYAMWTTGATDLAVADRLHVGGEARVEGRMVVDGQARLNGGARIRGPVDLTAGSVDLDEIAPATIGRGLTRDGAAMNLDDAYLDARIRSWVRGHCRVQLGWRDSCHDCNNGPSKRVTVQANGTCIGGVGTNTGCRGVWGGVNTDGDVGNDDVFYVHLVCD